MVIPKKVEIFGKIYKIILVDNLLEKEKYYGIISYNNQNIKLDKNLPENLLNQTFMHEIIHMILEEIGEKDLNNEKFVDLFSNALYQVFKKLLK